MKPQSAAFLAKARSLTADAETMLQVELADAVGRTAYLAAFHAAQALIFERESRVFKTHNGVRSEFARLARHETRIDAELRAFLGYSYQLKSIADYESGPDSKVTIESARNALETAHRFVGLIESLLLADGDAAKE